jgi:NTE family protein
MIKNLAFRGAGVCGQAYTGAILELEKLGVINNLERVAGTSAGAIVATLLALRCTSKEIFDISSETDFSIFEDGNIFDKLNVTKKYGIHPGDTFLEWMERQLEHKGFQYNSTFADLRAAGCLDLHVFATDLNTQSLKQFSCEHTPNVPVAEAVRASMSIPLFFEAFQFSNANPDEHIYVDGGCVFNYPLSAFDNGSENNETLGLFIGDLRSTGENNGLELGHMPKYIKCLIETLLNAQSINVLKDAEDMSRTIVISNCGISATNFDLSVNDKASLFEAGRRAVIDFYKGVPSMGATS